MGQTGGGAFLDGDVLPLCKRRQTDRQTERQAGRQADKQTDRYLEINRQREKIKFFMYEGNG